MDQVKTYFASDNFTSRRTTGHNMLDPEALITGAELAAGFTYTNSHRHFDSQSLYDAVVSGDIPSTEVPRFAPRVFNAPTPAIGKSAIVELSEGARDQIRRNGIKVLSILYGTEHSI